VSGIFKYHLRLRTRQSRHSFITGAWKYWHCTRVASSVAQYRVRHVCVGHLLIYSLNMFSSSILTL